MSKTAKRGICLVLYFLVPVLLLVLLAQPAGDAVRRSGTAAFLVMAAALGAVCLNWCVYMLIRRKRPTLLVFTHGILCLIAVELIAAIRRGLNAFRGNGDRAKHEHAKYHAE